MNRSYRKKLNEFRGILEVDNTLKQQKPHNYMKDQKKVRILQVGREIEKSFWKNVKSSNQNLIDNTELKK